ncbi:PD-(D/E)XK motif protein [Nonlabens tegetincola]|uniref:PD-(D/E)XK motif protein n=1 Tax=Nonlabens tegetincola TaxID=323273 RepID=UPI000CF3CCF7|nr:PD-(D/E)XK motif protein [Nonlabens tegetincola]PQJ19251.1 hypothetical protein BST93_05700 [Nonlabens tegetincola]
MIKEFTTLEIPSKNGSIFNAKRLERYPFAKIGINQSGFPSILIDSTSDKTFLNQKNIRLEYLELLHNLECKVTEEDKTQYQNYTIILFKSKEFTLQKYFLGIVDNLLSELSKNPSQKEIYNIFNDFIEIFKAISSPPKTTVQGLWCELLLIETSLKPQILLEYWHNKPEEKFDFNADQEKIEVKSSSTLERKHIFTSEQLNAEDRTTIIISSIFARQSSNGKSIADLIESIKDRVGSETLIQKLLRIVGGTLGNVLEQGLAVSFDYELGKDSINFYDSSTVSKIERINIPSKVSEVKFKSDLSEIETVNPKSISNGILFSGL